MTGSTTDRHALIHGGMAMMRFTGKVATVACLLGLATATHWAPVGAATPAASTPKAGGTWTVGTQFEIATLDTLRTTNTSNGLDRSVLVFDTLMKLDSKTGAIIPGLAQSVTTTDAQTWTLKLRPNLKFSDGTPLDADAVIFNYQRFKDPASAYSGVATVAQIAGMTATNSTTVDFKLAQPNGSFPLVLTDAAGQMASPTAVKADPRNFGQKPVGAGPYLLKEWVRDQQSTFVRNPNYFDAPRPYIDTIVYRVLNDANTMTSSLKAGDIDAIHGAQAGQAKFASDDPKAFRASDPTKGSGAFGFGCNLERTPCNDARFREAVSLAFDFKLVKQVFLADYAYPGKALQCPPFGPGNPFCAKDQKVKFDPARAKKLIDAVKADGINTDITFVFIPSSTPALGEFVQQQLAKLGVNVAVRAMAVAEYVTASNAHNFQTAVVYNSPAAEMGTRYYNDWHSTGGPNAGRDVLNLVNAQLDVALERGRNSVKLADRIDGFQTAQRVIARDFLVQWISPQLQPVIFRSTLQLPSYVNQDQVPFIRYTDAWIKGGKK